MTHYEHKCTQINICYLEFPRIHNHHRGGKLRDSHLNPRVWQSHSIRRLFMLYIRFQQCTARLNPRFGKILTLLRIFVFMGASKF